MKIKKVILRNFKSYYGECTFDLSVTDNKNIVVIFADGGYGKTTLMQAINWALYDESFIDEFNSGKKPKDRITIKNWINEAHLDEVIHTNKLGELSVEMLYINENEVHGINETHSLLNKITFTAESESDIRIVSSNQILKKLVPGGTWTTSNNAKVDINRILPANIKNYFIFDAEKQSSLIMPNNQDKVQEAIFKVVGLQSVQNSIEHLKEIAKEYSKELSRLDLGDINALQRQKTDLEDKIESDQKDLKLKRLELSNLKGLIEEIESKLREIPDTSAAQKEIDGFRSQKSELQKSKKEVESELSKCCYRSAPFLIMRHLKEFNSKLLNLKDEGKIPGSLSKNLLNEILSTNKCICGISLDEDNEISTACNERIRLLSSEITKQSEDKEKLLDIFNSTTFYLSSLKEADRSALQTSIDKLDKINDAIASIEISIHDLEVQIGEIDDQNIIELTRKKEELISDQETLNQQIGSLDTQIGIDKESLKEIDSILGTLVTKNVLAMELRKHEDLARNSAHLLEEIFSQFSEQARKEISDQTLVHWHKLIPSTKMLHVEVDESYSLKVTNIKGQSAIFDLSEGQKQSLVLAFVAAISDTSQKFPPYIIDMPFGRLGEKVQSETAQFLPKASHQVILLLNQTSEWNDTTRQYLKPYINQLYELEFNSDTRKTTIIHHN